MPTLRRRYDVMVYVMQISLGGKMQISLKLELCRVYQDQIRNQRPRLRRNRLFLGRKEGGGFPDQCRKSFPLPRIPGKFVKDGERSRLSKQWESIVKENLKFRQIFQDFYLNLLNNSQKFQYNFEKLFKLLQILFKTKLLTLFAIQYTVLKMFKTFTTFDKINSSNFL